ncbi:MAG: type II secretory pathway, component PulD [Pseudomonadota bacterium]
MNFAPLQTRSAASPYRWHAQSAHMRRVGFGLVLLMQIICFSPVSAEIHVSAPKADELGPDAVLSEVEFKDASIQDAIRILSELAGTNIVATREAGSQRVTLFLRNISIRNAVESMSRVSGLWYRYHEDTGLFVIMTAEEYQRDLVVFRNDIVRTFTLKYQNVQEAAQTIADLFGDRVTLNLETESDAFSLTGAATVGSAGARTATTSGSNRRLTRSTNTTSSTSIGSSTPPEAAANLTVEQLRSLQAAGFNTNSVRLEEGALAQVASRDGAPIFVTVNYLHNLVFVRTSDELAMRSIEQLIKEVDRVAPQVLLEMKILEVTLDDGFRSIFDIGFTADDTQPGAVDGQPRNPLDTTAATGGSVSVGIGNFGLEGGTFIFQAMSELVRARLQVLERDNRVKVLSTPVVLASNNQPAQLFIGEERILTTGFEQETIQNNNQTSTITVPTTESRDVGNTLQILPSINADRTVTLRLSQDTSTVVPGGNTIPAPAANGGVEDRAVDSVRTAQMESTVMVKDGMTVALGGLIRNERTNRVSKVPLLGDVPILGKLFRREERSDTTSELILIITPRVFTTPGEGEAVSRKRIASLSDTPGAIDAYLDENDRDRSRTAAGQRANREVQRAGAQLNPLAGHETRLVAIASRAIRDVHALNGTRIRSVKTRPAGPLRLIADSLVTARLLQSWTDDVLFVSAVELRNLANVPKRVTAPRFSGKWRYVHVEHDELPPGTATKAFLVSDKPFLEMLTPGVLQYDTTIPPKPVKPFFARQPAEN